MEVEWVWNSFGIRGETVGIHREPLGYQWGLLVGSSFSGTMGNSCGITLELVGKIRWIVWESVWNA